MSQTLKTYSLMCIVGLIGTSLQLLCYSLLRQLGLSPFFANLIAVSVAIFNNFILNHKITFGGAERQLTTQRRFKRFVLFSAITASLQSLAVYFFTIPVHGNLLLENTIVFIVIVFASVINFYGYRRFVWPNA